MAEAQAEGLHRPVGDRLLRRPRRARSLDEESQPGEGFAAELPAEWEAAEREVERLGIRTVILRTGLVLTKDGGLLKQLLLPFKLGLGGPLGSGEQFMSWIHIDDEVGPDPLGARQRAGRAASSTRPRRTPSPTASSPRRSGGPCTAPR